MLIGTKGQSAGSFKPVAKTVTDTSARASSLAFGALTTKRSAVAADDLEAQSWGEEMFYVKFADGLRAKQTAGSTSRDFVSAAMIRWGAASPSCPSP